ncbi:hypothetical protein Hypma_014438 [Hypsizygus marmoreus]|uniref:Secreted protein n=1 Tax=Hypsizygus marmoreus TaxID=39966 RepID=A0A369JHP7_HYPMA|nr:hypothetical protein Hypma_014438 [Hypsizygus marmoreus]
MSIPFYLLSALLTTQPTATSNPVDVPSGSRITGCAGLVPPCPSHGLALSSSAPHSLTVIEAPRYHTIPTFRTYIYTISVRLNAFTLTSIIASGPYPLSPLVFPAL